MSDVTFAPWRSLYVLARQDMYRDLRDSFNDYYMGQVAGLCVFSVTSPTSKLPSAIDVESGSGAVSSVHLGASASAQLRVVPVNLRRLLRLLAGLVMWLKG